MVSLFLYILLLRTIYADPVPCYARVSDTPCQSESCTDRTLCSQKTYIFTTNDSNTCAVNECPEWENGCASIQTVSSCSTESLYEDGDWLTCELIDSTSSSCLDNIEIISVTPTASSHECYIRASATPCISESCTDRGVCNQMTYIITIGDDNTCAVGECPEYENGCAAIQTVTECAETSSFPYEEGDYVECRLANASDSSCNDNIKFGPTTTDVGSISFSVQLSINWVVLTFCLFNIVYIV